MSEIVLENVSFYHGKDTPYEIMALKNVSVTIPSGKITGIIGHTWGRDCEAASPSRRVARRTKTSVFP